MMNERIQQMIFSLNEKVGVHWTNEDKIKFAELIVREAAQVVDIWSDEEPCSEGYDKFTVYKLKQHFGVE